MSAPTEADLRQQIVDVMRAMDARGLNRGTSGNVSARFGTGMLVTPSGVPPRVMSADQIVFVSAGGETAEGALRPSSEWQMHFGILARRPDVNAVVHCHARHATILACANKPIPPLHYMVGVSGKSSVPIAPYEVFGSMALADAVADTLDGGYACLMANHGLIAIAPSLDRALSIAEEMEEQAAIYCGTLAIGGPTLLSEQQMADIFGQFRGYGQKKR